MEKDKLLLMKKRETMFLGRFESYLIRFSDVLESKVVYSTEKLYWIEIKLLNGKNNRIMKFILSEGVNIEGDRFAGLKFFIGKLSDKNEEVYFSLKDFCAYKGREYVLKDFFLNETDFDSELDNYLSKLLFLIEDLEIQDILFTDYWTNIKPDLSPYK